MSARTEFNKKGEEILDFVDAYGILRCEHLEKIFPGSKKIVGYLTKHQRLHKSSDGAYISSDPGLQPDKCIAAALGVLADIIDKVQSHTRAAAPSQISFVSHSGDYYEIIYVEYGMEALVTACLETQLAAKQQSKDYSNTIKRMVIVESKSQMTRLQIPGIVRFALVLPDGSLSYFKGS